MAGFSALAICGGLGAIARVSLDTFIRERIESRHHVRMQKETQTHSHLSRSPRLYLGICTVNFLGAFFFGLLAGMSTTDGTGGLVVPFVLATTGFLGGFTTFSTAMVDIARLLTGCHYLEAAALGVLTCIICVAACAGGYALGA